MNDAVNEVTSNELSDWRRLLTAGERAAMLRDIACVSLAVGPKLLSGQPWSDLEVAPGAATAPKSPAEQLEFIEHLLPRLEQNVRQIAASPLMSAAAETRMVRPELARRVSAPAWMAHARQVGTQAQLRETKTRFSPDTQENRAVCSFLAVLLCDCRAIALIADAEDEAEAAGRAAQCAERLARLTSAAWLAGVSFQAEAWVRPATQRGSRRPDYASVYQAARLYRRGFRFDWNHPLLTLPPRETWKLYETWCWLAVFEALRGLGWEAAPPQNVFAVRIGRLTLALAAGQKSEILMKSPAGEIMTLTYNRTFAEGRESLTHTMRPDITLSVGKRLWVLDAKFKPYCEPGEEGSDINQMHAYRDAIGGAHGGSVARAWCLYAGLADAPNRAHITYGRGMGAVVGALCLRPGAAETAGRLRDLLREWLA